jgi:hypothetical protein
VTLPAAAQPFAPNPLGSREEPLDGVNVSVHSKVVHVPFQPPYKRGVLLFDRQVSMAATPVGDGR